MDRVHKARGPIEGFEKDGKRWRRLAVVALTAVALIAAACGDDESPAGEGSATAVQATAKMDVTPGGPPESFEEDGPRIQVRGGRLSGTITMTTDEGERSGEIVFLENEDVTFGGPGPGEGGSEIAHIWGTASVALDQGAVSCEGPFALSSFPKEEEGHGAVSLRCDDGSFITGELRDAEIVEAPDGFLERLTRELDGWMIFVP